MATIIGGGGEVLGVALDSTGALAPAGIPINVASGSLIAAGVTTIAYGVEKTKNNIANFEHNVEKAKESYDEPDDIIKASDEVVEGGGKLDEAIKYVNDFSVYIKANPKAAEEIAASIASMGDEAVGGGGKSYNAAKAAKWKKPDGSTWWPDDDGFVGTPTKETLQPGTKIDRYGNSSGKFAAPEGTPYSARSLPSGSESSPYNSYEVIKPFDVNSGVTAPWFDQPGGGTQYQLPMTINDLLKQGYIR